MSYFLLSNAETLFWQYTKKFLLKYRGVCIGCVFIIILFLWMTSLKKLSQETVNYQPLSGFGQTDKPNSQYGNPRGEQERYAIIYEMEVQSVKPRNTRVADNYFVDRKNRTLHRQTNEQCAPYPMFSDLVFANQYWQVLETANGTVYVLSAAYDNRPSSGPVIRLVTAINRKNFTENIYCQFWFKNVIEAVISEAAEINLAWQKKDVPVKKSRTLTTYIVSCSIPTNATNIVPESVSLVSAKCDLTSNNVKVYENEPVEKKNFGVCVRAIDFYYDNNAANLVEWIELIKILGADKIHMYLFRGNTDFKRVLDHYERDGTLDLTEMTIPEQLMPFPWFIYVKEKKVESCLLELTSLHDCLFRNMHKYKYISLVDIDEVLMPVSQPTWLGMFDDIEAMKNPSKNYTYYHPYQTRFWTDWNLNPNAVADIPSYTPMLHHITRADFMREGDSVKGFYDTRYVVVVFQHYPLVCIGPCSEFQIPTNISQHSHYRRKYDETYPGPFIIDKLIWKFKDELIEKTQKSLMSLGLLDDNIEFEQP